MAGAGQQGGAVTTWGVKGGRSEYTYQAHLSPFDPPSMLCRTYTVYRDTEAYLPGKLVLSPHWNQQRAEPAEHDPKTVSPNP